MRENGTEDSFSPTDAQLALFVVGGCRPAEMRQIEEWVARGEANRDRLADLATLLADDGPGAPEDVEALWTRIRIRTIHAEQMAVVGHAKGKATRAPRAGVRRLPAWKPRRVAVAAALLVIGSGLTVLRARSATNVTAPPSPAPATSRDYSTGRGQHVTIQLADGSRITLAPQTHVRIPPGFGVASREIEIDGEAVVEVVHDAGHPFRVHAGSAIAEDLGTRFDIRRYAGETSVRVAVAEGAVSLGKQHDATDGRTHAEGVLVKAGSVARLEDGGGVATVKGVRVSDYFGWTDGALAFNDMAMEDVARTLDRWFAVRVRIDDNGLRQRRVTARFSAQGERSIVDALAETLGAEAEWRDSVVTLRPRP